jgi:hypothetical protein
VPDAQPRAAFRWRLLARTYQIERRHRAVVAPVHARRGVWPSLGRGVLQAGERGVVEIPRPCELAGMIFDWDAANVDHVARQGVTSIECEEASQA